MSGTALTEVQSTVYELLNDSKPYDLNDLREHSGYKKNLVEKAVHELMDMQLVFQYESKLTGKIIFAQCVDLTQGRYFDLHKTNNTIHPNPTKTTAKVKRHRTVMTQDIEDGIHKALIAGNLSYQEIASQYGVSLNTVKRRKAYYEL